MTRGELAERIRAAAFLEGEFTLRSGRKSSFYIDKYLFETQPEILRELGKQLAQKASAQTSRIAGAELGGVSLAAATAMAAQLPFVIIRNAKKDYGTGRAFEGRMEPGDRVLLVEDIATTGGQILEAARVIEESGATVERIVAVVDRREGAAENIISAGYVFESLLDSRDLRLPGAV
ncbi:MAG: orotate phosphoribosyltransferase [Planctomycetota bacterium]|nr:orotate phosphoribosyltransferase [Planctomycetota bacterium]MCZ6815450.1 orotate phosphoribosyltransferase [Planctomycetota bacterium]